MDLSGTVDVFLFFAFSFMICRVLYLHILSQEYRNTGEFIVKQSITQTIDKVVESKGRLLVDIF